MRSPLPLVMVVALASGCREEPCAGPDWAPHTLTPYENPFTASDPLWSPQPHRDNPLEVAVVPSRGKAYVSLQASVDEPGHEIAVVDLQSHKLLGRIDIEGAGPTGLAVHPDEHVLVVLNRFSNFATLIDTDTDKVLDLLPTDYYAIEAEFTPDGKELWVSNRWRDAVSVWPMDGTPDSCHDESVPVGSNPRDLAMSPDGETIAVAALTGMTVSLVDRASRTERQRIAVGAPVNGLAFAGEYLVVATLSASTHHRPLAGPDTNNDGVPGDGTPNVNFQDLQNELAIYNSATGEETWRYTSDSICCMDYRDVDPDDNEREGGLLPPSDTWIVEGALPEQVAVVPDGGEYMVFVTFSGSNQLQRFRLDAETGALSPQGTWSTAGHNPHGVAVSGDSVLVTHRLSETLGFYDAETGALQDEVVVGDLSGGEFPATDAELGELFNFVTAPFSVDGDQVCAQCHREGGNIDKAFSMPLTRYEGLGMRMTMAYRGAADTRPWFFETAMDESNFKPVINEFARIENFCCTDYTLFPQGSPEGCADNPPPECTDAPNTGSGDGFAADRERGFLHPRPTDYPTREEFYRGVAESMTGRTESFGDGLFYEDLLTGEQQPIDLDFDGLTRALGLFLLVEPRLLPNPNNPDLESVRRGQALFESMESGCSTCHPSPSFSISTAKNPFSLPVRLGAVVSPNRNEEGLNLDLFADGFMDTFPLAEQESCVDVCGEIVCEEDASACDDLRNVRLGVPPLRGIWDRAPSMLHDGRARGLREVLATPGHPVLEDGEQGFNESGGIPDTHGGTSHLSPADIGDLIAYLESL